VTLNGATYQADPSVVHWVVFSGNGGSDAATLTDRNATQTQMHPGSAAFTGNGYDVTVSGASTIVANGGPRVLAYLYDSRGNDTFVGTPGTAYLQGPGFHNQATGYKEVLAWSTAGGADQALLRDSPGNDTFAATPTYAFLAGSGFRNQANGFRSV